MSPQPGIHAAMIPPRIAWVLIAALWAGAPARANPAVALAENGHSDWQIKTASNNQPVVAYAAAELRAYFSRISGVTLQFARASTARPQIVVGVRSDLSPEDQLLLPARKDGAAGYASVVWAGAAT